MGEEAPKGFPRRRKRPYKARVSTKIRWALDNSLQSAIAAQGHLRACLDWMDKTRSLLNLDNRVLAQLGKLDHEFAHLALDLVALERTLATALAESRPQKPPAGPVGAPPPKPIREGRMTKEELDLTLLQMWRDDLSYRAIGERLDVSYEYVRLVLKQHGVQPRPPGGRRKKA